MDEERCVEIGNKRVIFERRESGVGKACSRKLLIK